MIAFGSVHNKPTFILDKIDENVVTFQTAKWPNWLLANRNPWTDSRFSFQNSVFYRQPRADFDHHHTQKENLWIFLQSTGNIWPEDARHLWREKKRTSSLNIQDRFDEEKCIFHPNSDYSKLDRCYLIFNLLRVTKSRDVRTVDFLRRSTSTE